MVRVMGDAAHLLKLFRPGVADDREVEGAGECDPGRFLSYHLAPFRHTGPSPAGRKRPAFTGGSESFSGQLYCAEVSEVPGDRHFCGSLLLRPNSAVQPQSAHLPAACLPRSACLCVAPVCRCVATGRRRQGAGQTGDLFPPCRLTCLAKDRPRKERPLG